MQLSKEAEEALARLEDIIVREVSLVDRAANKHEFLIVKAANKEDPMTTKTKKEGEGAAPAADASAAPAAAPAAPAPAAPAAAAAPAADAPAAAPAPAPAAAAPAAAAPAADAPKPDDSKPAADASAAPAPAAAAPAADAPAADAPAADAPAAAPAADDTDPDVEKHVNAMAGAIGAVTGLQKVGAKISSARMTKLRQMHSLLGDLLKDLGDAEDAAKAKASDDDKKKPPFIKGADAPAAPAAAPATDPAIQTAIDDLKKTVTEQGETIKKQTVALKKAGAVVGDSNVVAVEGGDNPTNGASKGTPWPTDMNASNDRASVAKSRSFHDV